MRAAVHLPLPCGTIPQIVSMLCGQSELRLQAEADLLSKVTLVHHNLCTAAYRNRLPHPGMGSLAQVLTMHISGEYTRK
jgi:hypothetical protein